MKYVFLLIITVSLHGQANCQDATALNLAAPTSEHINGYDFLNKAGIPAQAFVYYGKAADHGKKIHIYMYDTDETVLAQPKARAYAAQIKAIAATVHSMLAIAKNFDDEAAKGNPAVLAAGHKRATIISIRGIRAAVTIANDAPENVAGLFMMVNERYAIQIETEHYANMNNDNREVEKLLAPFAAAIALETLIK